MAKVEVFAVDARTAYGGRWITRQCTGSGRWYTLLAVKRRACAAAAAQRPYVMHRRETRIMTLQAKIDRFLNEARAQGVGTWSAAPPIVRLAWAFKLDLSPPIFWSFRAIALFQGIFFGVFFFAFEVLIFAERWPRQLFSCAVGGVLFGLGMAWFFKRIYRRWRFSPWNAAAAEVA